MKKEIPLPFLLTLDDDFVPQHFGINVKVMEKTEKTMLELEIDYNQRAWEWSRLTESGTKLVPKFGPGFTGADHCCLLLLGWFRA